MTTARINGHTVHIELLEPSGDPPAGTAVLVHGMGWDSLTSWYLTAAQPLSAAGWRVVTYDLRGHGHSERTPTGYRLEDFVDDLAGVLREVGVCDPPLLVGNSFGGTIGFAYAMRHPVAALATIESVPPTPEWMGRVRRRLEQAAAYLPDRHAMPPIVAARGERAARRASAVRELVSATTLLRDLASGPEQSHDRISALSCPMMCVFGQESSVADFAPLVKRLLPHARIVVVPGQRHSLLIDQPQKVSQLLLSWLDQHFAHSM
jgi:pimeloyl-ACP methyl ester carboxylesterase